jgi:adenosylmethionine-8-amino-7-oxononanoate aminotransferase
VFFSDDGSTAVEVAVKMALQYFAQTKGCSRKRKLVALEDAFHGETIGAASLGGVEAFRAPFGPALFACLRIPSPAGPLGSLEASAALRDRFADDGDEIAAIVLEPLVQGAAGMRVYDPGFLVEVRELCSRHDVLLIADEVFTGYGRTGRMWACDHAGVTPDILCVGKGFSGGMLPMAATLATEQVFEGFYGGRSRAFLYGHSYCGNPLGAAVAREVLAVLREDDVIAQTRGKAERIAAAFHAMQALPFVSAPRALGMIGALDLQLPHGTNLGPVRDGVEAEADLSGQGYLGEGGWLVYEAARRRGVFLRPLGETVYVCPPLVIGHADLERVLRVVRESIEEVVESAMMRSTSESWRPPPVG